MQALEDRHSLRSVWRPLALLLWDLHRTTQHILRTSALVVARHLH